VIFELSALCHEAIFKPCFYLEIFGLREKDSLTLDTPTPGSTAFINHARDMVWLGFKPWE